MPQQEWRDQPGEGGQSGKSLCGQIQTCEETQERRSNGEGAGCSDRGAETLALEELSNTFPC